MGKLLVKDKEIVVPGEILAQGMDYLPSDGAFREKEDVIASRVGLVNISGRLIKVVQLSGRYLPKVGDIVIGEVVDIGFSGWQVNFGWAYNANLSIRDVSEYVSKDTDLSRYYDFGDIISAKITKVIRSKIVDLSAKGPGLRKLKGGKIVEVAPAKVPRIIGKQGSMISMIKEATGCNIVVGQNGKIWISGPSVEKEKLTTDTFRIIEEEAHKDGLTDKINDFLKEKSKS